MEKTFYHITINLSLFILMVIPSSIYGMNIHLNETIIISERSSACDEYVSPQIYFALSSNNPIMVGETLELKTIPSSSNITAEWTGP